MADRMRVGVVGLTHDDIWGNLEALAQSEQGELVAAAVSGRLCKIDLPAEDNAVLIMQHAGAISTSTASWTQIGHLTSYVPMFYGSTGTIVVQGEQLLLATNENEDGEPVEVPPPSVEERNSAEFFLSHIRSGKPIEGLCSPDVSLKAQEVLEAALLSVDEGCTISLPLPISYYVDDTI